MKKLPPLLSSLLSILILVTACQSKDKKYYQATGSVFHTFYSIKYESNEPLEMVIERTLLYVDSLANPFNPASILYAVNNNLPQKADTGLIYLYRKATEIAQASDGRYDITVGPMVNAWGFGYEKSPYNGNVPQEVIDSLHQFIGYEKVTIECDTLKKADPRVSIDMASIAKGFASDKVAEALRKRGVENYLVEIGGEITFRGLNPQGKHWTVGINVPSLDKEGAKNGELEAILTLEGAGGVATSGNYRNYKVDEKGNIYAHTIDPVVGQPIQQDVISATILAPDCTTADAIATACMVVGSKKALALVQSFEGVECFLLVANGEGGYKRMMTEGIAPYVSNP